MSLTVVSLPVMGVRGAFILLFDQSNKGIGVRYNQILISSVFGCMYFSVSVYVSVSVSLM